MSLEKAVEMIPKADRRFPDLIPEQRMPWCPRLLCISDPHFKYHNRQLVERMLEIVYNRGIDTVLWNGDMLNNGHRGHAGRHNIREASFEDGIEAWTQTINALNMVGVKHHWMHPGNHDDKVWRDMYGEMLFSNFWDGWIAKLVTPARYHIGDRYYTIMDNPQGYDYRFTHQFGYSQIPGRVANKLSIKFLDQIIVTGHQHHASLQFAADGKRMLIDLPMLAEQKILEYTNMRDTPYPIHKSGFTVLEHGYPTFFLDTNSPRWWAHELARK